MASPEQLASLVQLLVDEANNHLMMRLAFKIVAGADLIPTDQLIPLWIPFSRLLGELTEKSKNPLLSMRARHISDAIFEISCRKFLGKMPRPIWSPYYRSVDCMCSVCGPINHFLSQDIDVLKNPVSLTINKDEQAHAKSVLGPRLMAIACGFAQKGDKLILKKLFDYGSDTGVEEYAEKVLQLKEAYGDSAISKLETLVNEDFRAEEIARQAASGKSSTAQPSPVMWSSNQRYGVASSTLPGSSSALPSLQTAAGPHRNTTYGSMPTFGSATQNAAMSQQQTQPTLANPFVGSAPAKHPPPVTYQVYAHATIPEHSIDKEARELFLNEERAQRSLYGDGRTTDAAERFAARLWDNNPSIRDRYYSKIHEINQNRKASNKVTVTSGAGGSSHAVFASDRYLNTPAPSAPPAVAPDPNVGFEEYAAELEPRLRKTGMHSPEAIRRVLAKRWDAMSPAHRTVYVDAASTRNRLSSSSSTAAPAAHPNPSPGSHPNPSGANLGHANTSGQGNLKDNVGFQYYLNNRGLEAKIRRPDLTYDQIVAATEKSWVKMLPQERADAEKAGESMKRQSGGAQFFGRLQGLCRGEAPTPRQTDSSDITTSARVKREVGTPGPMNSIAATKSERRTPGSGRTMQSTWRGWGTNPPSSPSSRVLASMSTNRMTSSSQPSSNKRKHTEVIDLTLDDD
ncbi:hypothetical protein QBC47DRAFT_153963 [Echria macrotheca]|uniref:Uncharacterized protein n=1 Tax=Echria macrotheca TaxID=438768 RepID=A0AAJ0BHK4_9PEZI|nr:hypothetical protein QBC47DRAFT_153963 [Echria macrotheca]